MIPHVFKRGFFLGGVFCRNPQAFLQRTPLFGGRILPFFVEDLTVDQCPAHPRLRAHHRPEAAMFWRLETDRKLGG